MTTLQGSHHFCKVRELSGYKFWGLGSARESRVETRESRLCNTTRLKHRISRPTSVVVACGRWHREKISKNRGTEWSRCYYWPLSIKTTASGFQAAPIPKGGPRRPLTFRIPRTGIATSGLPPSSIRAEAVSHFSIFTTGFCYTTQATPLAAVAVPLPPLPHIAPGQSCWGRRSGAPRSTKVATTA